MLELEIWVGVRWREDLIVWVSCWWFVLVPRC